jgi:EAL domain-containing protein (putative c-di-GMP-specific phosphodiesterase class I)/PAS domain-containing protein
VQADVAVNHSEFNMYRPIRVLIIEHRRADRWITQQLLADYDLDFTWRCVGSERELRTVASAFDPDVVLCTDDLSMTSNQAVLDAMRLLCSQTPVILVSSVREITTPTGGDTTEIFLDSIRQSFDGLMNGIAVDATPPRYMQDITSMRLCFSAILESSLDPVVMSDSDGWITHANTSACRRLGESLGPPGTYFAGTFDQPLPAPHWLDLAHDANQGSNPCPMPFAELRFSTAPRIRRLAYFDLGTGQPGFAHVNDLIASGRAGGPGGGTAFALVSVKLGNSRLPEEVLDRAPDGVNPGLESVAPRYGSIVQVTQEDYLVVLPATACPADAVTTVQRVLDSLARIRDTPERSRRISPVGSSTGIPADSEESALPLGEVGASAQTSESTSRGRIPRCAEGDTHLATGAPLPLQMELGDALQRRALGLHFQPQYDLGTGRGCGVEALARWILSTGEIIPPSVFIPLAERAGMIQTLGAWVLRTACEAAYAWCSRDAQRTTLSVNVSALQIDDGFCTVIERALKQSGFPAKQLELEITESALIANPELTIEYMKSWKQVGVRIAMDDFGTGYSSLDYLSRLPVDRLKLDQSLVHMMTRDPKSAAVMRSIVALGAELDIDVIAEGVETEEQLKMLTDLGCPRVQGYLLGRPMPAIEAQIALRKTWGNRLKPADYRPMSRSRNDSHAASQLH